ncbi:PIN domain-containing protein [Sulfolobus sp. S-194]|uniref:PIN domain-containing protein n=1 Tax=Sulfolobus sp. S-194 TaxID=2512240 RepID=UPI001437224F|nr:PIN domain-containing protein [Sulfolobus sp. S-194]QIW23765.1 PIN domain-containing protein [Sulfolobus sp. S-194]
MEKRLANLSELIVDTSFLLPLVGIRVKGVEINLLEGKAIYYPSLMLTELLAIMFKEAKKLKLSKLPEEAMKGLIYILSNVRLIPIEELEIEIIYEILNKGWNDIFDAILYTAYKSTEIPLVTMDKSFYSFLKEKGIDIKGIILL